MKLSRQFPPQTGPYHLQVKNGAGWHDFDTARLHISVGQPYHEGDKFRAQAEWIRHRFDRAIVCVNDTLQRHNMMFDGMSEERAADQSARLGAEWIERNKVALRILPAVAIHRWADWTARPDFAAEHERVKALYDGDADFRKAVDDEVLSFWQRRRKKTGLADDFRFDAFKTHSTAYLLEETAAFFVMFKQDRAVDIYPGSTLLPCALAEKYGPGEATHFTRVDFKRKAAHALKAA